MVGIIGAGFAGLFTAWNLTERNIPCTVVGKTEKSASFAAQGIVGNKGLFLADSELFADKIRGARTIARFCRDLQHISKKKIIAEASVFEPFSSVSDWQRVQRRVYRGEFYGCFGAKLLRHAETSSLLPNLYHQPPITMQYSFDSVVDVEMFFSAMRDVLTQRGVRFVDEHVTDVFWDGKWNFHSKSTPLFESHHLFLAPGVGIGFFRDALDLNIPSSKVLSGFTFSHHEEHESRNEFVLLHETKSFCQFSHRCSIGSSSRKGPLLEQDAAADFEELENIFGKDLDLKRMKKNLIIRGGERVAYKNMEPLWGRFESRKFSQPVYLLSGIHKSGLQLSPILSEQLVGDFIARSST